jgi:5,6-dimethylbenzimidazole synthase
MMEFYEAVSKRRTVREFKMEPVDPAIVKRVLGAGMMAPSGGHVQEWEFVLLMDPEAKKSAIVDGLKARDLTDPEAIERLVSRFEHEELRLVYRRSLPLQRSMMLEAPEVLVVCYKPNKPLKDVKSYFELNPLGSIWMCIQNVMLALAAEGLYGCTYTAYETSGLKRHLGIPDEYEVASIIPFGYPKHDVKPHNAIDVTDRMHIDKW